MGRWVDGEAVQLSSVETLTRLQHALKRAKNELLTARSNDAECGFGDVERMARLPLVPVVRPAALFGPMICARLPVGDRPTAGDEYISQSLVGEIA